MASPQDDGAARVRAWRPCIVTETYEPDVNGVALTLRQLVHGLRARGHDVSLVRPRERDGAALADLDGDVLRVRGVPLPRYPGLQLGLPAGRALERRWTARRPDVVYVATEGPLGWSAVRVATRLGIPIVSGYHTNFDRYLGHYGAGWLRGAATRCLRRFHNATAATLVATDELRTNLAAAGYQGLRVLGRGVDTRLFAPSRRSTALRAAWGLRAGDLAVLYVGRVAAEKNLPLAVHAFRAMQHAAPRRALQLVVVGDGPLRATLRRANPDAIFCGVQHGPDLARHYASGDVFLLPSETETFGNVTLEAMASGLAVVAYDYAAARAHISHAENGWLAPYRDAGRFVDLAAALACGCRSLVGLRRRAREAALAAEWPRVVDRFEQCLRQACPVTVQAQGLALSEEVARR
jgi:glycosyltransferase involved in cell wall biosynthesis